MGSNIIELAPWQSDFLTWSKDKSFILLSASTGSGKTLCYEEWMFSKAERPIYITAPTKSLCNEKYRDLKARGYNVGLETGDVCYLPDDSCDIICCTHEVYNYKYRSVKNSTLIVDEADFVFKDPERARIYMESIMFSEASNTLICSASFGDAKAFLSYMNRISGREFSLYESSERLTKLEYKGKLSIDNIRNSFVVAFSKDDCHAVAEKLRKRRSLHLATLNRRGSSKTSISASVNAISKKYGITNQDLISCAYMGIAFYYGKLLPKEKAFIEELVLNRIVDTVVGTDAIAVGVNFPFEKVVFSKLRKGSTRNSHGGLIPKSLFVQLSGRAGRKAYYPVGYVHYCNELCRVSLQKDFEYLRDAELEPFSIVAGSNIGAILSGDITIEDDVRMQKFLSTVKLDDATCLKRTQDKVDRVRNLDLANFYFTEACKLDLSNGIEGAIRNIPQDRQDWLRATYERLQTLEFKSLFDTYIAKVYLGEFSISMNCRLLIDILFGRSLDDLLRSYCYSREAKDYELDRLLDFRKYMHRLPEEFRSRYDLSLIDGIISTIDATVLTPGSFTVERKKLPNSYTPMEAKINIPGKFDVVIYKSKKYIKIMQDGDRILLLDYATTGTLSFRYIPLANIYSPSGIITRDKLLKWWERADFSTLGETISVLTDASDNEKVTLGALFRKRVRD